VTVQDLSPIEDRDGWIGGIESIVVDGRRWYFGFDYSSDLVLSPLIDDEATMAEFASRHMSQRDGDHDVAYWRELAADSVTTSDLTDEAEDREYSSEQLAAQRLTPCYYLSYLLGAAAGWPDTLFEDGEFRAGLRALRIDDEEVDYDFLDVAIDALDSSDSAKADAGRLLMSRFVEAFLDKAPGNWPVVFSALRA
jgi:hypothetical protein